MMLTVAAVCIAPPPIAAWRVGFSTALVSPPPEWKWMGMWCAEQASHRGSHDGDANGGRPWRSGMPDITMPLCPSFAARSVSDTDPATSQKGTFASGMKRSGAPDPVVQSIRKSL